MLTTSRWSRERRCALLFIALLATTATVNGQTKSPSASLDTLRTRLASARLERTRWERVIAVQADLAQHPNKLASAASEAADELQSEGRSLTVEGLTLGVSGVCATGAAMLTGKDWRTAKKLTDAVAAIEASHKVFVEGLTRGAKQPEKTDAGLEKAAAALKLAVRGAPDKKTRDEVDALISIGTPALKLLSSLMRGDQRTTEEDYALMKDTMEGTRAMMLAFIQHRNPKDWIGVGRAVAKAYPKLGAFAGAVAAKGVVIANLLNSVASAAVGGYAWHEGIQLESLAEDLRANQQRAAMMLQRLLPHARQARESALRRETRLARLVQAIERANPPASAASVPPSRRILDDGLGIPPKLYSGLSVTLTVLQTSPPMTYHLTRNEIRRREEIARAERAAAEERERATRVAQQRARREADRASRDAREREERAQSREREGRESSRADADSSRSHTSTGTVGNWRKVVDNVLPNW